MEEKEFRQRRTSFIFTCFALSVLETQKLFCNEHEVSFSLALHAYFVTDPVPC